MQRGEIRWVDFDERRPVVLLSDDESSVFQAMQVVAPAGVDISGLGVEVAVGALEGQGGRGTSWTPTRTSPLPVSRRTPGELPDHLRGEQGRAVDAAERPRAGTRRPWVSERVRNSGRVRSDRADGRAPSGAQACRSLRSGAPGLRKSSCLPPLAAHARSAVYSSHGPEPNRADPSGDPTRSPGRPYRTGRASGEPFPLRKK